MLHIETCKAAVVIQTDAFRSLIIISCQLVDLIVCCEISTQNKQGSTDKIVSSCQVAKPTHVTLVCYSVNDEAMLRLVRERCWNGSDGCRSERILGEEREREYCAEPVSRQITALEGIR